MSMRCRLRPVLALLLGLLFPLTARAWGRAGHEIIGTIAERQLSPATREKVCFLLDGYPLAVVAPYPDEWRIKEPRTAAWHFVNIPLAADAYDPTHDCLAEPGCIVTAIDHFRAVLAGSAATKDDRAKALTYIVHLIGDAHQPLHVTDNNDLGGNLVRVTFFGAPTNLHALWDDGIIAHTTQSVNDYATRLLGSSAPPATANGTTIDWINEAHQLARQAYAGVPPGAALANAYFEKARPIVDVQLLRAGIRVAAVLEAALADMPATAGASCAAPVTTAHFEVKCPLPFAEHVEEPSAMSGCGLFGSGSDHTAPLALQNAAKNNLCATNEPVPIDFTILRQLQAALDAKIPSEWNGVQPPSDRRPFQKILTLAPKRVIGEGVAVSLVAFVKKARVGGIESVNCKLRTPEAMDITITLVPTPEATPCESVTAEVIPHYRPTSWTTKGINLPERPMRFTGQLFTDASHRVCKNGAALAGHPARFTIWEIHPVYRIDVCAKDTIAECDAANPELWKPLTSWLEQQ